ncbi:MAG: VWA domain-containing protein [Pseudomonadota bacterium]|nr:VWA domain-containing protein [Pseudomonadota bacterium]
MQRLVRRCSGLLLFAGTALNALAISTLAAAPPAASESDTAPRDTVLVLDNSGSMKPLDPQFLSKKAVERFVEGMPDNARVSLVIFDEQLLASPLALVPDRDARRVRRVNLAQLNYRGPWTNTPAAVERAIQELKINGRSGAAKSIVLLNDDVVDTGRKARDLKLTRWLRETLTRDAAETGIKIFTISLSGRSDVELLQEIAQRTGGRYFLAQQAADVAGVFAQVADTFFTEDVVQLPVEPKAKQPVEAKPEPPQAVPLELDPAPSNLAKTVSPPGVAEKTPLPPTTDTTSSEPIESGSAIVTEGAQTATTPATESAQTERTTAAAPPSVVALEPPAFSIVALVLVGGILVLIGVLLRTRKSKPALKSPPEAQLPQAFLYDLSGVTGCERHELGAITLIGRVPPSERVTHIVINRPSIGRRHAVIEREHHGFWLVDQNSKNCTSLNGYTVIRPVCLTHGDRVQFHDFAFEFSLAGMALADATVAVKDLTLIKSSPLAEAEQRMMGQRGRYAGPPVQAKARKAASPNDTGRRLGTDKGKFDADDLDSDLLRMKPVFIRIDDTLPDQQAAQKSLDDYFRDDAGAK